MDVQNAQYSSIQLLAASVSIKLLYYCVLYNQLTAPWPLKYQRLCWLCVLDFLLKEFPSSFKPWRIQLLTITTRTALSNINDIYRPRTRGDNTFGSVRVCVCVCPFVFGCSPVWTVRPLTLIFGMRVNLDLG